MTKEQAIRAGHVVMVSDQELEQLEPLFDGRLWSMMNGRQVGVRDQYVAGVGTKPKHHYVGDLAYTKAGRFMSEIERDYTKIKHGSTVTIAEQHGKDHYLRVGKAVMLGPAGWVLDMGGQYGTPGMVSQENFVRIGKPPGFSQIAAR